MKRILALAMILMALSGTSVCFAADHSADGYCPDHPYARRIIVDIDGGYVQPDATTHIHVTGFKCYCSVCGKEIYDSAATDAYDIEPHVLLNGICTKCGYNTGTGKTSSVYQPNSFSSNNVNRNFPARYIRDVSYKCGGDNGITVGFLGVTGSKGANVRSFPNAGNSSAKVRTLHAGETVYVYYNTNGWYYIVCSDGTEGYVSSSMIQVTNIRK